MCDVKDLVEMAGRHEMLIEADYRRNIEIWESEIQQQNMQYIFFEDITDNGRDLLAGVCSFLGVDPDLLIFPKKIRMRLIRHHNLEYPSPLKSYPKATICRTEIFWKKSSGETLVPGIRKIIV